MKKRPLTTFLCTAALLGFLLGIHDGRIALWKDGSPEPVQVFPYRAAMLPREDRQALENGIPIGDDADLAQLIEDYLS